MSRPPFQLPHQNSNTSHEEAKDIEPEPMEILPPSSQNQSPHEEKAPETEPGEGQPGVENVYPAMFKKSYKRKRRRETLHAKREQLDQAAASAATDTSLPRLLASNPDIRHRFAASAAAVLTASRATTYSSGNPLSLEHPLAGLSHEDQRNLAAKIYGRFGLKFDNGKVDKRGRQRVGKQARVVITGPVGPHKGGSALSFTRDDPRGHAWRVIRLTCNGRVADQAQPWVKAAALLDLGFFVTLRLSHRAESVRFFPKMSDENFAGPLAQHLQDYFGIKADFVNPLATYNINETEEGVAYASAAEEFLADFNRRPEPEPGADDTESDDDGSELPEPGVVFLRIHGTLTAVVADRRPLSTCLPSGAADMWARGNLGAIPLDTSLHTLNGQTIDIQVRGRGGSQPAEVNWDDMKEDPTGEVTLGVGRDCEEKYPDPSSPTFPAGDVAVEPAGRDCEEKYPDPPSPTFPVDDVAVEPARVPPIAHPGRELREAVWDMPPPRRNSHDVAKPSFTHNRFSLLSGPEPMVLRTEFPDDRPAASRAGSSAARPASAPARRRSRSPPAKAPEREPKKPNGPPAAARAESPAARPASAPAEGRERSSLSRTAKRELKKERRAETKVQQHQAKQRLARAMTRAIDKHEADKADNVGHEPKSASSATDKHDKPDKPEKPSDPHLEMPEAGPYHRLEFPSTTQIAGMSGRTIGVSETKHILVTSASTLPLDRAVVGECAGPSATEMFEDAMGPEMEQELLEIPATIEDEMVSWWLAGGKAQVDGDNTANLRLATNYLHHSLLGHLGYDADKAVAIMQHVPMRSLERAVAIERERASYANRHFRIWRNRALWWAALLASMAVLWLTVMATWPYDTRPAAELTLRSDGLNHVAQAGWDMTRGLLASVAPRVAAGLPAVADVSITVPWPTTDWATYQSWRHTVGLPALVAPFVTWYHDQTIIEPSPASWLDLFCWPGREKEWFNVSFLMGGLTWFWGFVTHAACAVAIIVAMNYHQLARRETGGPVARAVFEEAIRTLLRAQTGLDHSNVLIITALAALIESKNHQEGWRRALKRLLAHLTFASLPPAVGAALHACHNAWCDDDQALDVIHSATRFKHRFPVYRSCNVAPAETEMREGAAITRPRAELRDPHRTTECVASLGITAAEYRPVVYAANANNELSALNARVVAAPPCPPNKATLQDAIHFAKKNTINLLGPQVTIRPDDLDEYLRNSNASPQVKELIRKQAAEDQQLGIGWNSRLSMSDLHKRTTRTGFPKVENNNYRSPYGRKSKAARLIQGGSPGYIRWVGPWFSALQRHLKKALGAHGPVLFTSGKTSEEVAAYVSDVPHDWQILEDDIGKFDMSIDKLWCKYEVWLAKHFGAPAIVLDLMRANINTHGATMSGYKYKVPGTRKSGDPFTSLFNSIINAWTKLYAFSVLWKEDFHGVVQKLRMVVQGDDNLLRHAGGKLEGLAQIMAELGFESECTYRRSLLDAEFCSMRMLRVNGTWTFTPKAGRFLSKFGSFVNPPPNVSAESLMRGVALSSYAACSPVRPLRKLLDRVLLLTDRHAPHFIKTGEWVMKGKTQPDAEDAFEDFCLQYAWDYGAQARFEQQLATAQLGDIIDSPEFRHLCDIDTNGPKAIFLDHVPKNHIKPIKLGKARVGAWRYAASLAIVLMLSLCCLATSSNPHVRETNTLTPKAEEASLRHAGGPTVLVQLGSTARLTIKQTTSYRADEKLTGQGGKHAKYPPYRPVVCSQCPSGKDVRVGSQHIMSKFINNNKPTNNNNNSNINHTNRTQPQATRHNGKAKTGRPAPRAVQRVRTLPAIAQLRVNGHGERKARQGPRIRGRGDYDVGGALGGLAGSLFGMPEIGSMLGSAAQKIIGRGDYDLEPKAARWQMHQLHVNHLYKHGRHHAEASVQEPMPAEDILRHHVAAKDGKLSLSGAKFGNGMERPRVRARELIGSVIGSKDFTTMSYRIQPGALGTNVIMPWGSNIAKCFQQYKLNGMMFEFESRSSEYTSQTSLGTVYMSTQYAANASELQSEETVAQNDFTTSEKPSHSFTHWIECADADNPIDIRYVSASNSVVVTDDLRLNDVGLFQVSVVGCPDTAVGQELGKIWCTYDIEFLKKKMPAVSGGTTYVVTTSANSSTYAAMFADPSQVKVNSGNSLPVEYDPSYGAAGGFLLPVGYSGKFMLVISSGGITGSGSTGWQVDVSDPRAITPLTLWSTNNTGTNLKFSSEHGVAGNDDDGGPLLGATSLLTFHFDGSPGVYLTLAGTAGSVTSIRGATLIISALDPDIAPFTTDVEVDPALIRAYLLKVEAGAKGTPFTRPASGTIAAPARDSASAPAPRKDPVVESLPDSPAGTPLTLSSSLLHALTRAQLR